MIELKHKADCCGCTACYTICHHDAINFKADKEGFFYPVFDKDKCIECGLCEKVCPIIKYKSEPKIGNPVLYAAINLNPKQYMQSSSGGIFILLCKYIISKQGIVCGAIYNNDFVVKHAFAQTLEECKAFQGSKYVQSDLKDIFYQIKSYLKAGKYVLFSGTPCQVAGLKLYLQKDYENLFTVDIICHGVPSPLIFKDYLEFIKGKNEIKSINMKSKSAQYGTAIQINFKNGKSIRNTLKTNLWYKLYFKHYIIRPSCHKCQFTHYNRSGDLTIGDSWGLNKFYPNFHPNKMASLILLNTVKGHILYDEIKSQIDSIAIRKEESIQPQLQEPTQISPNRNKFWDDYSLLGFKYIAQKYLGFTNFARIKFQIKAILKIFQQ